MGRHVETRRPWGRETVFTPAFPSKPQKLGVKRDHKAHLNKEEDAEQLKGSFKRKKKRPFLLLVQCSFNELFCVLRVYEALGWVWYATEK